MRVLILNGALGPDPLLDALTARIEATFTARQCTVETVLLHETPVSYCQGCFECWTHTPGICKINDQGRDLSHDFSACDIAVIVTPVQFGSYSSESKKMLDRALGTLLPFFRRIDGEVHHSPRYAHPPALGILAVDDTTDPDVETTVRVLALRNAINFASPMHSVACVERRSPSASQLTECDALVAALMAGHERHGRITIQNVDQMLPIIPLAPDDTPPKRAMLLVGSAKPRGTSTSESLGGALASELASVGIACDTRHVVPVTHSALRLQEFVRDLRGHELLILAAPIYIDAVPALLTRAMEAIVADRAHDADAPPLTIAMLLNCGFPESRHGAVARTIGGLFARRAHARWAGALQLGAGGVISGRSLAEVGHMADHLTPLLHSAAEALAHGRSIPPDVREAFAVPLMPTALYMAAGDAGWLWTATHEGALTRLWARPAVVDSQ